MCLEPFLREYYCKKREIEIQREPDISLEATLKEREQLQAMIKSNFSDLNHIDSEGVNHVEMDSPVINKS